MKRQGVLVVLLTAAATTAFTVMLLAPGSVDAVVPPTIKAVIAQPQFESQGGVFTLKVDKAGYDAGDKPIIELTASNPTDRPLDATIGINISASSPSNPDSRMPTIPKVLWSQPQVVSLNPGEVKTLSIASDAKLPAGGNVLFTMTDKQRAVLAVNLGVQPGSGTSPASPDGKTAPAK